MRRIVTGVFLIAAIFYIGACSGEGPSSETSAAEGNATRGKEVYGQYCVLCHGEDGKREVNGAKDITVSQLTYEARVELITNGKNLMTPFKGIMTEQEIRDAAAYSMTLGK